MHISIEKGKTLIIRLMAVGPVVEGRAQRDVWFEVNGEVGFIFPLRHCIFVHLVVGLTNVFLPFVSSAYTPINTLALSPRDDQAYRSVIVQLHSSWLVAREFRDATSTVQRGVSDGSGS